MDLAPFRSYDPAIGRWWQADPIAKAWESPYAAMFNSPMNWADPMGLDPEDFSGNKPKREKPPKGYRYDDEGNLMPKKEFVIKDKRQNNTTLPSNLFFDGDQAYYQRGNTWYVQEHAPIEEGGTRTYGLDPRHGWVFVRSDYESYKGYVKAADNLVTAMEVVDAVGISVGLSAYGASSAGLTLSPMAMSRYLAAGARYAPRAGGAAYGAKSARDALKASEVSTSSLNPTQYITKNRKDMQDLFNEIRDRGIEEPIIFAEQNGSKFILDGHHRYYSALKLGIRNVPAKQVKLPWGQYKTPMDLMIERGKNPAFWKFIK
jgi:hypothetical protein